ncbi:C39 family peptidase [Lysinibacillus telephonicus]|uniref:Uncharacterized protein n=1 Tax=Lysinibacillus telephonicus TaxID=1714840 RepID=A0A431UX63_9BACI|nr:C39 family peptidase [Lysinibacillus telephonicus]RTQ96234.1 hypothetical protein EKG35_00865 [Lysinibacillus telephonicus]
MEIKKFIVSFLVIILFSIISFNNISAKANIIELDNAKIIAEKFKANSIYTETWKYGELVFENLIYDVDDSLLGYHFIINEKGQNIGYIVVSASENVETIFSFGTGSFMNEDVEQNSGEKIYFINPVSIVTAKNTIELNETFEKNKTELIDKLKDEMTLNNLSDEDSTDSIREEIELIENLELKTVSERNLENNITDSESAIQNSNPSVITPLASNPLPVRRVYQRSSGVLQPGKSCGPAVGVMMSNYYYSIGYESINNSGYYGGDAKFINHLASSGYMKTGTVGTSLANFEDGLRKHLNLNLTSNLFDVARTSATNKYSTYKNLINSGHPVAIRFTNIWEAIFGSSAYSWHYVLGTGYSGSNVIMLDPDGSSSGTKTFNYTTYQSDMNLIWIIP